MFILFFKCIHKRNNKFSTSLLADILILSKFHFLDQNVFQKVQSAFRIRLISKIKTDLIRSKQAAYQKLEDAVRPGGRIPSRTENSKAKKKTNSTCLAMTGTSSSSYLKGNRREDELK